jgi:lipoprotein-anchoring transpeptidase ErfK/SrfK
MRTPTWALLAATVALAAACGGPSAPDDPTSAAPADEATSTTVPPSTTAAPETTFLVARASAPVSVSPSPGAEPTLELPATTTFGSPRALLVLGQKGSWLRVALPERPNGSTGWVQADDVELREVDEHVEIDLAARTLTLIDAGEVVLTTPVAIGATDAPTPTGSFYVVDKLATGDLDSPYGLFAFGLSAFSDIFTDFAGGDGQVGIHGTNDPSSIGQAVSHGCTRVPNDVAQVLDDHLHLGTPVTIG